MIKTLSGGLAMISLDSAVNLYKTGLNGNVIWKKQLHHSPKFGPPMRLTQDLVDSSFYVSTGYVGNTNTNLIKIDKSGNLVWSKTLLMNAIYICGSSGGGFVVTGGANYDNYLLRFDGGGNIVWQNRYQTSPPNGGSVLPNIIQCKNSDYVISGISINKYSYDPHLFRVDSSGTLKWFNIYDLGPDDEFLELSAESIDKSVLVCGYSNNSAYWQDLYLRVDSLGNILNFKKYHSTYGPFYSVILDGGPNRVLMAGSASYSGPKNSQDLYTYMDYTGNILWNKTSGNAVYSGSGPDAAECGVAVSSDCFVLGGNFIAMIDSAGNGFCNSDTILLKDTTYAISVLAPAIVTSAVSYSTTNNITIVSTPPATLTSYCNFSVGLSSNLNRTENQVIYPNPVNSNSEFELKSDLINENSEIIISDVWGRKVFSSKLHTGINRVPTLDWNNGVYFFTVCDDSRIISTGKISVVD